MQPTASAPSAISPAGLRGSPARRRREQIVKVVFLAAALVSILISVLIVWSLVGGAVAFLQDVVFAQPTENGWYPRRDEFGLLTLIVGSLLVTAIALVVAVPVGLLTAIYLAEYANQRARKIIKPVLEILAGIPRVVLGFFALTWISPVIVQRINPASQDFNLAAAGIGVGILTIPLIASISEDSMRAVP